MGGFSLRNCSKRSSAGPQEGPRAPNFGRFGSKLGPKPRLAPPRQTRGAEHENKALEAHKSRHPATDDRPHLKTLDFALVSLWLKGAKSEIPHFGGVGGAWRAARCQKRAFWACFALGCTLAQFEKIFDFSILGEIFVCRPLQKRPKPRIMRLLWSNRENSRLRF